VLLSVNDFNQKQVITCLDIAQCLYADIHTSPNPSLQIDFI
jgi:hypothetical protein